MYRIWYYKYRTVVCIFERYGDDMKIRIYNDKADLVKEYEAEHIITSVWSDETLVYGYEDDKQLFKEKITSCYSFTVLDV